MRHPKFLATQSIWVITLLFALVGTAQAQSSVTSIGSHTVLKDETLYCIGRAYGVLPSAIAQANGLRPTTRLVIGQKLIIPSTEWAKIPVGPVCASQFQSPFIGSQPTSTPISPISTPSPTPISTTQTHYVVQSGDTLWRIATRFKVTVNALQAENSLPNTVIYVGQILRIPSSTEPLPSNTPAPVCLIKGNISFTTGEKIYHVPGGQFYNSTIIRPEYGERWFCTEEEAVANGWRKSER